MQAARAARRGASVSAPARSDSAARLLRKRSLSPAPQPGGRAAAARWRLARDVVGAVVWLRRRSARVPLSRRERDAAQRAYFDEGTGCVDSAAALVRYLRALHVDVDADQLMTRYVPTRRQCRAAAVYQWEDVQVILERIKAARGGKPTTHTADGSALCALAHSIMADSAAAAPDGGSPADLLDLLPAPAPAPRPARHITRDRLRKSLLVAVPSVNTSDAVWSVLPRDVHVHRFLQFFDRKEAAAAAGDADSAASSPTASPSGCGGFNVDEAFVDDGEIEASVWEAASKPRVDASRVERLRDEFLQHMARLRVRVKITTKARLRWYALARAVEHGGVVKAVREHPPHARAEADEASFGEFGTEAAGGDDRSLHDRFRRLVEAQEKRGKFHTAVYDKFGANVAAGLMLLSSFRKASAKGQGAAKEGRRRSSLKGLHGTRLSASCLSAPSPASSVGTISSPLTPLARPRYRKPSLTPMPNTHLPGVRRHRRLTGPTVSQLASTARAPLPARRGSAAALPKRPSLSMLSSQYALVAP